MPNERLSNGTSTRPVTLSSYGAVIHQAGETIAEQRLRRPAPVFVGHSAATRRVQSQIHRAVRSNQPVLIVGAVGTGKSIVAEILHHFGGGEVEEVETAEVDEDGRLVRVGDFGYLCALEDLSLEQQLRIPALTGLGRLVIGTRLDPDSSEGQARLHPQIVRWCGVRVDLPTLGERIEDLEALVIKQIYETPARRPVGGITDAALDCLRSYAWPGNVSELENVIREAIAVGATEQIELRDLPARLRLRDAAGSAGGPAGSPEEQLTLEFAERTAIKRALEYARGNKRKAARLLRIGKTTLYRKLKTYELE